MKPVHQNEKSLASIKENVAQKHTTCYIRCTANDRVYICIVYRRSIVELMPGRKGTGSEAGEGAERKVALQTQIGLPFCLTLSRDVARSCYSCSCCFFYCQA